MPAKSRSQQKAAGMALAAKDGSGRVRVGDLRGAAREMFEDMTTQQLRDFAGTKHKNLPEKKRSRTRN